MYLTIWIILLTLSLIMIFAGRYVSSPPISLTAYTFLFLLGLVLLSGVIEYKSGEIKMYNYTCEYLCDNRTPINSTGDNVISSIVTADVYTPYSDEIILGIAYHHIFGLFIMLLASFGFITTLFDLKPGLPEDRL